MNRIGQAIELLMDEAGPTLRYLTASQVIRDERLARRLRKRWKDDLVSTWLDRLRRDLPIHGGNDDTFETVTGKLFELGANKDVLPLVRRMSPYLETLNHRPASMLDNLHQVIVASAAARLGFDVSRYASRRLAAIHQAVRAFDFDIYRDPVSYRLPKPYKNYPVVKEAFAPGGVFRLPYVHDLYLLNHVVPSRADRRRYEDVVRYVLDDRYQRLPHGFGYVEETLRGKPRWLVVGWKANFDGTLMRMELAARLPKRFRARADLTPWELDAGWLFPAEWLAEQSPGYWVAGQRMALTPAPRRVKQRTLESTFRAVRLLNVANTA